MSTVAVVAHARKSLGGGLRELREVLAVLGRAALRSAPRSPFVETTRGRSFRVTFEKKLRYELDGGVRPAAKDLRIEVHPRSVTICVPA